MRKVLYIALALLLSVISRQPGMAADTPRTFVRLVVNGTEHAAYTLPAQEEPAREAVGLLLADPARHLSRISVRSGASPDGKSTDNRILSDRRSEEAVALINSWAPASDRIDIQSAGEDYAKLRTLLEDSDIPGAEEAMRIIDEVPVWVIREGAIVSSRKKELMDIRGGQTWHQMREELFPLLQETDITFDFQDDGASPAAAGQTDGSSAVSSAEPPVLIYFPFDNARILPGYRTNARSLAQLDSLFGASAPMPGDTVVIVGKASMDGPASYNKVLSARRAEAIRSYIASHFPHYAGVLSIRAEGEPWSDLRDNVAASGSLSAPTRDTLLGIIDSDIPADRKEAQLKATPGWSGIARKVYPGFRTSSITHTHSWTLPRLDEGPALTALDLPATPAIRLRPDRLTVPALTRERTLRPVIGISTNLLYDITYIPNYGLTSIPSFSLEYYPARNRHFTFGADVEWPMWQHWDEYRFFQIQNIGLWTRFYFKKVDERYRGLYLSGGANAARYGIGWDAKGWEGEGLGASLGLGHKWILGKSRLFIDLGITGGIFWSRYDPYVYGFDATERYYYDYAGDPDLFKERNQRLFWGGPTRIFLSIGVDLFNRKQR